MQGGAPPPFMPGPAPGSYAGPGPPMMPQQPLNPGPPPVHSGDYGAQPPYQAGMAPLPPPMNAALADIGPFVRPIFNKIVRILSGVTSLVALILHFAVLGQGITSYMKPARPGRSSADETSQAVEEEEVVEEDDTSTTRRRSSSSSARTSENNRAARTSTTSRATRTSGTTRSTRATTTELLGRALSVDALHDQVTMPARTAEARLLRRGMLRVRQNEEDFAARTTAPAPTLTYVPNSDVPARDGAVGFTASSHLFAAVVILLLFWLEWLLFVRKPTMFGYWGPLLIAVVQLYMAFDILGRSLSVAAQAGGHVLLLMSVLNLFLAGWTVLQARKKKAAPPMQAIPPPPLEPMHNDPYPPPAPYPAGPDLNAPPPPPMNEGPLPEGDPNAMPYMGEKQNDLPPAGQFMNNPPPQEGLLSPRQDATSHIGSQGRGSPRRRRASTGGRYNSNDIDSYNSRSPSPRQRRYSYRDNPNRFDDPPSGQPMAYADDVPGTSPISLYGPQEYQRRLEQQRRSRRQSLVQPTMQFDPNTGGYVEPAGRFVQRSSQRLPDLEEEEDEINRAVQLRPGDPRLKQDGFATRTRVWKRLQNNTGIV